MAANMPPGAHGLPPDWDEDRRPALTGALILFIVLTVIAVIARITLQLTAHRRLYWDDLFIGLAMVPTLGLIACDMFGMSKGLGLHITRVMASDPRPPGIFITLWKVGFTNSLCIYLALFCIKMSLLWLYRRLFWIARWFRIGWYANLAFASCIVVAAEFTAICQCTPVSFAWERMYLLAHIPPPDGRVISGHCINNKYTTAMASLSLVSDFAIWSLPMAAVVKLQMTVRRKVELCCLLSFGFVAIACGLVKAVINDQSVSARDVSWANAPLAIWSCGEMAIGILCACIPVIAGGIKHIIQTRRSKSSAVYHAGSGFSEPKRSAPDSTNRSHSTPHKGTFLKSVGQDSVEFLPDPNESVPRLPVHSRTNTDVSESQSAKGNREWV